MRGSPVIFRLLCHMVGRCDCEMRHSRVKLEQWRLAVWGLHLEELWLIEWEQYGEFWNNRLSWKNELCNEWIDVHWYMIQYGYVVSIPVEECHT